MSRVDHWQIQKLCNSNMKSITLGNEVDHWIIPRKRNRNRIKSGKLGNVRHNVKKVLNGRPGRKNTNNVRKMLGKPMLRRVHLVRTRIQYGKKILNGMYMYGGKNHEN